MHIAVCQGSLSMVDYLLRYDRVDAGQADIYGNTALHHAAAYGHERVSPYMCFSCNHVTCSFVQIFESASFARLNGNTLLVLSDNRG